MLLIIKPILFAFLKSDSVKKLVVDLLEAYVARTDNKLDDQALKIVKEKLFSCEVLLNLFIRSLQNFLEIVLSLVQI